MSQIIGREFRKTGVCPSSEILLEYADCADSHIDREKITPHLSECDFCKTEVEMYRRFPQDLDPAPTPRIPRALLEYATALLVGRGTDEEKRRRTTRADGEMDLDQACGAF